MSTRPGPLKPAADASRVLLAILLLSACIRAQAPDLVVDGIDDGSIVGDWQTLIVGGSVDVTISNAGPSSTSTGFTILVFEDVDRDGSFTAGLDGMLGSGAAMALGAGQTSVESVLVSGSLQFREAPVAALVDSGQTVAESDESNNVGTSISPCQFQPPSGVFSPAIEWSWTSSAAMPDFLNVIAPPVVIDLDGDGTQEVVFVSTNFTGGACYSAAGVLRVLRGTNGQELFTVTNPAHLLDAWSGVAAGDLDGDGVPEIIGFNPGGTQLVAFANDGTHLWNCAIEPLCWGAIAIADLDQDGLAELVVGRQVISHLGTVVATGGGGRGHQFPLSPAVNSIVADVDQDGTPEIVAGDTIYGYAGGALTIEHGPAPVDDGYTAVANFDGDAMAEIVHVADGFISLFEHDLTPIWGPNPISLSPQIDAGGPPTIADFDGDGQPEIGVADVNSLAVFETNGALLWRKATFDASGVTGASVFDFDGDGVAEVLYRDEFQLRIYRGTDGEVLFQMAMSSCTAMEYPLVVDVDSDDNAEIVVTGNNNCGNGINRGVYVYGDQLDNWVTTGSIWNQHSFHITNVGPGGSIPAVEADNWLTPAQSPYNNYRQNALPAGADAFIAPDLTASFLRFSGCTITARIANAGSAVAPAAIPVSFWDGDPAAGGVLLGLQTSSAALQPGEFEDVVLTTQASLAGTTTIFVIADSVGSFGGTQNECDEDNNTHSASLPALIPIGGGQANSPQARLELDCTATGTSNGPFALTLDGAALRFDFSGPANGTVVILAGAPNPGVIVAPGLGSIDVGTPPAFSDLRVLIDGSLPGFPHSLFNLAPDGTSSQILSVGGLPPGFTLDIQGVVGFPFVMTAAFYLTIP